MISAHAYILFVAPVLMGFSGLVIYLITDRLTRSPAPRAPGASSRVQGLAP